MQELRQVENIALVGFMGTGKSSVGHAIASILHFHFVDTDELIERQLRKRISEIFQEEGEEQFRKHERSVVAGLESIQKHVIATGGGVAVDPRNLVSLKRHALIVCLWASAETVWERVRHQSHRPLLNGAEPLLKIQRLLAQREPFYRQADVLVNTELRSVREVALQVVHQFRLVQDRAAHEIDRPSPGP